MKLNQLKSAEPRKNRKRVGRGIASGTGKTCGSGHKGQKSRSGVSRLRLKAFEGGQNPLYRRLPKRGFTNLFRTSYQSVNLGELQKAIDAKKLAVAKPITKKALLEAGLIRSEDALVKLLAKGEIKTACSIEVDAASQSAVKILEKLGGKVTLVSSEKKASEKPKEQADAKTAKPEGKKESSSKKEEG